MSIDVNELRQIGKYPVECFLAEGGMAWVFKVRDPDLFDAPRALKLLKPGAAVGEEFQRFMAEAKILATIQHPNLIHVYDFGQDPSTGCHFYTMDYIEGETLGDIRADWLTGEDSAPTQMVADPNATQLASDPNATQLASASTSQILRSRTVRDVCEYFSGILSALARLHRERIIHRDIKPQNIFLTTDGIAILGDLGIAKGEEESAGVTQAGRTPGTPLYMSPEHSLGEAVTERSDLFSVGLSLYRVLTGQTVYDHASGVDSSNSNAVLKHLWQLHGTQAEFEFYFPDDFPEELCDVVRHACRLEESERYRTAADMNHALRDAIAHLGRPPSKSRRASPSSGRGRGISPLLIAAVVLIPLLAVGGWFGWQMLAAQSPARMAEKMQVETTEMGERVDQLVAYLSSIEPAPEAGLLKGARDELSDAWSDASTGRRDLEGGSHETAQRMFSRAQGGYSEVCQSLTSGFLEAAAKSRVAAAQQARKAIPASAEKFAARGWTKLGEMMPGLEGEIPPAGCDRADALVARMELSTAVVVQSASVQEELGKRLPEVAESAIAGGEDARVGARAARSAAKEYKAVLALGDASLEEAKTANGKGEFLVALEHAEQARVEFVRAASVRPAEDARAGSLASLDAIGALGLSLGSLRAQEQAAQREWERGEFEAAAESFGDLQARSNEVLAGARKTIAARDGASQARAEAKQLEVPVTMLEIGDRKFREGEIALRTWEFDRAEALFRESMEGTVKATRDASELGKLGGGRNDDELRALEERLRIAEEERNRIQREREADVARNAEERAARELEDTRRREAEAARLAERREREARQAQQAPPAVDPMAAQRAEQQRLAKLDLDRQRQALERERAKLDDERRRQEEERNRQALAPPVTRVIPAPESRGTPENPFEGLMQEYEAAIEARDMDRLRQVFAMSRMTRMTMEQMFNNCEEVSVMMDLGEAQITGKTSATLQFEQQVNWRKCRDRRKILKLSGAKTAKFTLRGGSEWQIKKIYDR